MKQTLLLAVTAIPVALLSWIFFCGAELSAAQQQKYSHSEYTWAVQWINNGLSLFMERGYIAKISAKDDGFDV